MLMNQQDEIGLWEARSEEPFPLPTVLVLEALRSIESSRIKTNDAYLTASRGSLNRSALLAQEDSAVSSRLAVIAAHQGIEAFLTAS